jgi:hypothetical protein
MIAAFMLHALLVGVLCALAAWATERGLDALRAPRRFAWILGMLATVLIPLFPLFADVDAAAVAGPAPLGVTGAPGVTPATYFTWVQLPPVTPRPSLDLLLAWSWSGMSTLLLTAYVVMAGRLARRARRWSRYAGSPDQVLVSVDTGPAVFGLLRPRIVVPRWFEAAPGSTQDLVLAHERQHLVARDPQLLAAALLVAALFPWNLALLWQLRRLRFAMEVDCDARVLAGIEDPTEYGEALLFVGRRVHARPLAAIALIERHSQLVRRIEVMTSVASRFRAGVIFASAVLGAACLFAASSLRSPALAAMDAPLKPTPTGASALRLGQQFERMLADRFPSLLEQDHERMPMVVVLLNEDWSIARAAQVISRDELPVDERTFGVIGLGQDDVPYVGNMGMQAPDNPKHVVLVVYTERKTPGKRFVSHVFPDTRSVDREIFRRYFPQSAKSGVPAGQQPWVLLDRDGHVLRSGQETVKASDWNRTLESRFPGIKTQGITVTPITNDAGEPLFDEAGGELQLHSVWLAAGSPQP